MWKLPNENEEDWMGKSFYKQDTNIEAEPDKTDKFTYKSNVKRQVINLEKYLNSIRKR